MIHQSLKWGFFYCSFSSFSFCIYTAFCFCSLFLTDGLVNCLFSLSLLICFTFLTFLRNFFIAFSIPPLSTFIISIYNFVY